MPLLLSMHKGCADSVFRMLYSRKEELLSWYNALNGTDYQNPEQLEVTILKNAIYMNMKNDVSLKRT